MRWFSKYRRNVLSGFTLVELLITLVILTVLAAVVVPNVGRFVAHSKTITSEANYIIYVTESGLQKQVGTITLGKMLITLPKQMSVDDSAEVLLRLYPSQDMVDKATLSYGSTGIPSLYYKVSDVVQLYPVMFAELKAANFRISSDASYYQALSLEYPSDWNWVVSPTKPGQQLISIQLSTPVQIEGYEQQVAKAVYGQSFEVLVSEPFNWVPVWLSLGAAGAFLGGLAAILKVRRRRLSINRKGEPTSEEVEAKSG